jgi:hypothetical protein
MQPTLGKKIARRVMALALLILPPESREWAAAMSAELEYVEGSFSALSWATGCLGTALKNLCLSLFSQGSVFAAETEGNMGKFAKISAAVLIIVSALFLFAPTFRQGLKLSTATWNLSDSSWLPKMKNLARRAEATHDAQTLAFVALQMRYRNLLAQPDRDKFADEAVQWDPNLTWIYSYMLSDYGTTPEQRDSNDARWLARLEAWAPNNAAVYAIEASYERPHDVRGLNPQADRALLTASPRWLNDINKAFSATDYDSYLSQARTLGRAVLRRDGLDDLGDMPWSRIGVIGAVDFYDFDLYAKDFLVPAGADFETKGDLKRAEENYTRVTGLAALIQLRGASDSDSLAASDLQLAVDPKLEALYEKTSNSAAAQFVAYQLASSQQTKSRLMARVRQRDWSSYLQPVDAYVVQLSLLAMILSILMIVSCGVNFVVRRLRSGRTAELTGVFFRAGVFGAILLFVSAITMYFGFSPYVQAFQRFLATPNPPNPPEYLLRFYGLRAVPIGLFGWLLDPSTEHVSFWYGVIALGIGIIVWILYRYLARTFRHSAPIQPPA